MRCPVEEAALLADPIRNLDPLLGILKRMLAQGADRALPFLELAHTRAGTQPERPREHECTVFIISVFVRQAQLQNAADACRRFRVRRFHGLLSRGGAGQREPSTKRCIPGPRYPAPHAEPLLAPRKPQSRFLIRPITSTRTRRWTDDRRGAPAFREQGHGNSIMAAPSGIPWQMA